MQGSDGKGVGGYSFSKMRSGQLRGASETIFNKKYAQNTVKVQLFNGLYLF